MRHLRRRQPKFTPTLFQGQLGWWMTPSKMLPKLSLWLPSCLSKHTSYINLKASLGLCDILANLYHQTSNVLGTFHKLHIKILDGFKPILFLLNYPYFLPFMTWCQTKTNRLTTLCAKQMIWFWILMKTSTKITNVLSILIS
jgi:hypothetical protein